VADVRLEKKGQLGAKRLVMKSLIIKGRPLLIHRMPGYGPIDPMKYLRTDQRV
jgi:hypothetical protein